MQRVLFLALLTLICSYPFFRSTIALGHDVMFHLLRIESIAKGLSQGILPVRLYQAQAYGLGYPCGVCYPDTFLYAPALLRCLGLSLKGAYVAFIVMVNAATAFLALYSFRRLFGSYEAGMACTALWALAPYRLCCLFIRASVGEYLALVFAPLLALGIWATLGTDRWKNGWVWLGLACAGIAQSHLLSIVLFALIGLPVVVVLLVRGTASHKLFGLAKAAVLATALSLWFVVPFLSFYTQHAMKVAGVVEDTFRWSLEPAQLLAPFQSFEGVSSPLGDSLESEMPLGLGWALMLGVPAWIATLDTSRKDSDEAPDAPVALLLVVAACVAALLTTYLFPWYKQYDAGLIGAVIGKLAVIQFPWRFLGQASILLALLWGVLLQRWRGNAVRALALAALCLSVLEAGYATSTYVRHAYVLPEEQLLAEAGAEIGAGEYLPEGVELDDVKARADRQPIASSEMLEIQASGWQNSQSYVITYRNNGAGEERISLPVLWCKLLKATATTDTGDTTTRALGAADGFVELVVGAQEQATVEVRFVEPLTWRLAEVASLLVAAGLVAQAVRTHRGRARENAR